MQIGGTYTIDFARVSKIPKFEVTIKSGDSKRTIKLILLKNSEVLNLNNYTVVVAAKKIDGKDIFNDVRIIDAESGICEVEITEQMLATLNIDLPCEIVLYDQNGTVASSSNFIINKVSTLRNEKNIVSSNEFTALIRALSLVTNINNKADKSAIIKILNEFDAVISNVTNGNTSATNSELVASRGAHTTLRNRLDSFDEAIKSTIKDLVPLCVNYGYIRPSDGIVSNTGNDGGNDLNWYNSDFINIDETSIIYYDGLGHKNIASVAFYDSNKKLIHKLVTDSIEKTPSPFKTFFKIKNLSNDAKYIRICYSSLPYAPLVWLFRDTDKLYDSINELKDFNKENSINDDLLSLCTMIGYISPNGSTSIGDTNWIYSPYIVADYDSIAIDVMSSKLVSPVSFYDENKNFIARMGNESSYNSPYTSTIQRENFPEGTYYIRFCTSTQEVTPYPQANIKGISYAGNFATSMQNKILNLTSKLLIKTDLVALCTKFGFIDNTGSVPSSDTNWQHSDFISTKEIMSIYYKAVGHPNVASISFYDESKNLVKRYGVEGNIEGGNSSLYEVNIEKSEFVPEAKYIRICFGKLSVNGEYFCNIYTLADKFEHIQNEIDLINDKLPNFEINKLNLNYIVPPYVYTVCNDVIPSKKGHNRNYSTSIYLDHLLNQDFTDEKHIRFHNSFDRVTVYSPIKVLDSNENNPTVKYNNGVNILKSNVNLSVTGRDVVDKELSTTHISVLNSVTKDVTPKVLCIGDSITYGELATINDDDFKQNWVYHLMCKELFKKDNIDNGGEGYECLFLGHFKKNRKMQYNGSEYDITTYHEGIRGASLKQYLDGQFEHFKSPSTGKFSIKSWLDRYRTLNDTGQRLQLGQGTGSLITSININDIDVCTPTHVLIMLSSNGGFMLEDYKELVNIIKSEFPNMIIGMAIPDSAGTYFPSLHPKCGENTYMWTGGHSPGYTAITHNQQYGCQKMLIDEYSNRENDNLYIVPFFFVQPTAESGALRILNSPDNCFNLTSNNVVTEQYGWGPNIHINAIGHCNWAYQLYSWLKYTIAKNIN